MMEVQFMGGNTTEFRRPRIRHPVTEYRFHVRMQTVGQRIRAMREAQGISRAQLAKAGGIGITTLSDLELDRSQSTTKLHRIAERLCVSAEWLATGRGDASVSHPVSRLNSTIVSRRSEIGLSVEEVHARLLAALPAGAVAPDLGTVKTWFDGTGRPLDVTQLKALYDALGLDLDEHRATPAKEPETAVEQAMLERFRRLPAGRQAKLLALLQDDDA